MRCEQIMRRPVQRAHESDNIITAARLMRDANIGFLAVCDDRDYALGVITDRDLAVRVLAEGRDPSRTTVGDVMSRGVVSCGPQDDLRQAQRLMAEEKKSRIVVVDQHGKVEGILSLADIAEEEGFSAADTLAQVASREVLDASGRRPEHGGR